MNFRSAPDAAAAPPLIMKVKVARQFFIFVGVGLATALIDIGGLAWLLSLKVEYAVATTLTFAVALISNYAGHSLLTFRTAMTTGTMFRYAVLVLTNYGVTMFFVLASKTYMDSVLAGKVASVPLVTLISFLGGKYWSFR